MIEAQIICSNPCKIPDLDLDLQRGEQVWLSVELAQSSSDLKREQAKGNVRVMRKPRRMDRRDPVRPAPPFVALTRPQHKPPDNRPAPVVEAVVDTDAIAREVQQKIVEGLRPMIAEELGKALANQPQQEAAPAPAPPAAQLDPAQLAGVLEGVLRRVMPTGGTAPAAGRAADAEDPLYMPANLVDKSAKAKIEVKETSSTETSDLDDAAAALRKIKRGRGRTDEENDK